MHDAGNRDFDVSRLARLVRLQISDDEKERMNSQIVELLEYFSSVSEIDISNNDECLIQSSNLTSFRPDLPMDSMHRDELLRLVPYTDGRAIVFPRAIDPQ